MNFTKWMILYAVAFLSVLIAIGVASAIFDPHYPHDESVKYVKVTQWCEGRWDTHDMQEACKWGAYEMLSGPEYTSHQDDA